MTSYTLRRGAADKTRADVVVVGVVRTPKGLRVAEGGEPVASAYGRRLSPLLSTLGFTGRAGEIAKLPTSGTLRSPLLMLVGLGEQNPAALTPSEVRRAAGAAARALSNAASVALALPAGGPEHVRAVVEGFTLGAYTFSSYKSAAERGLPGEVVVLTPAARTKAADAALVRAEVVARATTRVRDWVNTPARDLTPESFADAVTGLATSRRSKVRVEVLDERALADGGFGGIIGVGQGSANPPRLVRLYYRPRGARTSIALVGKGITFDSGGLNIKTSTAMKGMKSDMGGAAAVVAATFAVAEMGLPVAVNCYAPMAENMVSGSATRPGDVLRMYDGQTVEVLNPDAEGRLVLGDALGLAREAGPDLIVDLATLTGAATTGLGDRVAALLGNDDALRARVLAAAAAAGEPLWPMPIAEEMPVKVRTYSKVADLMQHNVDKVGGTLYAAAFLQQFVGDTAWAHLDIAGTAYNYGAAHGHVPSGGTGYGVATLVQLALAMC
ncbi:MAG TPA: leucyl aminopeptidase [Nocardioidaceae bacterium]|nr:leucyl aminopeptidase [Nocardioidaceae bacterium]